MFINAFEFYLHPPVFISLIQTIVKYILFKFQIKNYPDKYNHSSHANDEINLFFLYLVAEGLNVYKMLLT